MNALAAAAVAKFGALGLAVYRIPHRTADTVGLVHGLEIFLLADKQVGWLLLPVRSATAFAF